MARVDERFYLEIRIQGEQTNEVLWSTASGYSNLEWVKMELELALGAVRWAMGLEG